jgi:hypothetical protein
MNQQEATKAGTVSGLRAGRTERGDYELWDFSKNIVYDDKKLEVR